jgi:dTDP-4-dehydrorhamnose reductase
VEKFEMKILVTGGSGLLGKKLLRVLSFNNEVGGTYLSRPHENCKYLDVTDRKAVERFIDLYRPDIVIHTAAMKNADFCEENKELAWLVNVEGTKNLVDTCKKHSCKFVYISSDYVFKGGNEPCDEGTRTNPINFYGSTKLEGERVIKEELINYIIIRPTILYGYNDGNDETFITFMRRMIPQGAVRVDNYVKKYPLLIDDVASLIEKLLKNDERGTFHIGGKEGVTRYEWALRIAESFGLAISKIKPAKVQYKAPRPRNVKLQSSKRGRNEPIITSLEDGLTKVRMQEYCTFKLLYSSQPYESAMGMNVGLGRMELGKMLASIASTNGDMVVPIPETGIFYAIGYSDESGIPLRFGVITKRYSKKTLFEPKYRKRIRALEEKLKVIPDIIKGKKVILIDEAVLSGSTLKIVIDKIKKSGVKEIHIRIPSPPVLYKCPCGEHPPSLKLISRSLMPNTIHADYSKIENGLQRYFGVDSFRFLTLEALSKKLPIKCLYCSNNQIP